ncbi:MAG: hypothetical protein WB424_17415 [Terracidiphilus sp.]
MRTTAESIDWFPYNSVSKELTPPRNSSAKATPAEATANLGEGRFAKTGSAIADARTTNACWPNNNFRVGEELFTIWTLLGFAAA